MQRPRSEDVEIVAGPRSRAGLSQEPLKEDLGLAPREGRRAAGVAAPHSDRVALTAILVADLIFEANLVQQTCQELVHVVVDARRRLYELDPLVSGQAAPIICGDSAVTNEVRLVAHHNDGFVVHVVPAVYQRQILLRDLQTASAADVVDDKVCIRTIHGRRVEQCRWSSQCLARVPSVLQQFVLMRVFDEDEF